MSLKISEPIVFSPSELAEIGRTSYSDTFNIPLYQRLYSWGNKEIEKLLTDIESAADGKKDYYIGNITLSYNLSSKCFDIIDGQQRMTTLWLLGLVLKLKGNPGWNTFLMNEETPILGFTARAADTRFLKKLTNLERIDDLALIDKTDVNETMVAAVKTIELYFTSKTDMEQSVLSAYILNKVRMVAIFLPEGIDLNKYFEDMNNRGLQLEAHHILKANLLADIDSSLHSNYARIWDAVSQMNQYVEYGLRGTLKDNRIRLAANQVPESYFEPSADDNIKSPLRRLMAEGTSPEYTKPGKNSDFDPVIDKVGSVITFPEFLLHVLKLFPGIAGVEDVSLEDKKLLDTFKSLKSKINAEEFIRHLFKCRLLYDKYIIKSAEVAEGYRWEIRQIKADTEKDTYVREKHFEKVVQVQAMLNAATSLPVWFTETLSFLLSQKETDETLFLQFLEALDKRIAKNLLGSRNIESVLCSGTGTARYWFYNLDYLLWREWRTNGKFLPVADIDQVSERISNFQFRDNRSVEHIYPQHPEKESWPDGEFEMTPIQPWQLSDLKNRFGNLALISVGSNSSYSNQSPKLKKVDFRTRSEKYGIESLKLAFAYAFEPWSVANMEIHQQQMFNVIKNYHELNDEGT